jgi:hypothetical protein
MKIGEILIEDLVKSEFTHEIKSVKFWNQVLTSKYAKDIFKTIMTKQNGFASDRQMMILKAERDGLKINYTTKN